MLVGRADIVGGAVLRKDRHVRECVMMPISAESEFGKRLPTVSGWDVLGTDDGPPPNWNDVGA